MCAPLACLVPTEPIKDIEPPGVGASLVGAEIQAWPWPEQTKCFLPLNCLQFIPVVFPYPLLF